MDLNKKVSDFLARYKFSRLGVAVSGGADSICLLTTLFEIFGPEKLFAITVNHNIREEKETSGDALFVYDYCKKLGVDCEITVIEKGKVDAISKMRNGGIEEAARFLRYELFEKFIVEKKIDYLCLAHNKNDNLETVLMRFLQGSSQLKGISCVRGYFLRPILGCTRKEIENYLIERNVSWRTDKTNFENNYLRNKIRNILVPFLNENFGGWDTALSNFIEKKEMSPYEEEIVSEIFEKFKISGGEGRLPFPVVKEVLKNGKASFQDFEIVCKKNDINNKKNSEKKSTENEFYSIISKGIENGVGFDLVVRNFHTDDKIVDKDGKERSVLKILKNWKVPEEKRKSVNVVEKVFSDGRRILTAVLGKASGAEYDFIVK